MILSKDKDYIKFNPITMSCKRGWRTECVHRLERNSQPGTRISHKLEETTFVDIDSWSLLRDPYTEVAIWNRNGVRDSVISICAWWQTNTLNTHSGMNYSLILLPPLWFGPSKDQRSTSQPKPMEISGRSTSSTHGEKNSHRDPESKVSTTEMEKETSNFPSITNL